MKTPLRLFTVIAPVILMAACSPNTPMVASPRSPEFYDGFVNPADDFAVAENKIAELKVMEVGDEYPMRYILFADGRFYYQIDKLGDGTGWWKYAGGGLELTAVRPIFDMHLYLSAADEAGDSTVLRFNDRHGFNSVDIRLRDPQVRPADFGLVPTRLPELRPFRSHPSGI